MHDYYKLNINPEVFKKNLLLTQLYCNIQQHNMATDESLTDVASVFRSFIPEIDGEEVVEMGIEGHKSDWTIDPISEDKYINKFFQDQLLYKEKCLEGFALDKQYKGDIIVSEVDFTVTDGASAAESFYLFDDYDLPPIDTWFYLANAEKTRLLFAWIPDEYCGFADSAIVVNCVEIINWFKKLYEPGYQRYYKWNLSAIPLIQP